MFSSSLSSTHPSTSSTIHVPIEDGLELFPPSTFIFHPSINHPHTLLYHNQSWFPCTEVTRNQLSYSSSFGYPSMAASAYSTYQNSSPRGSAMVLAMVSALVLSPLYTTNWGKDSRHEMWWRSGFVLPVLLAGLIVAIKTTSSNAMKAGSRGSSYSSPDKSTVPRIGSSPWGLAGILIMLMFVLSWQASVQHFFWR